MKLPGRKKKDEYVQIPCAACQGRGKVYNQPRAKLEKCKFCGGSGKITAKK